MTPDCNHSTFAPAATASSATGMTFALRRNTSTTSTGVGMSATRSYGRSPKTGPSRLGLTGKILYPNPCSASAIAWLVRYGLSERPTTATVRDQFRRSLISCLSGFSCIPAPPLVSQARMLLDLHAQWSERALLSLGLDHHVSVSAIERRE